MGVRACSREGCESILCHRYSHRYGYLCGKCFEELIEVLVSERDVPDAVIRKFMAGEPQFHERISELRARMEKRMEQEFVLHK